MSYEELSAHAVQIYEKAVEEYLSQHYRIHKSGDRYYSPRSDDPYQLGYQQEDDYTTTELEAKVREAEAKFADVTGMFEDFTVLPEPGDFDGPINDVETCMLRLSSGPEGLNDAITGKLFPFNTALKDMTSAAGYLDEWDGLAMMSFLENFATPFPERCLNQFAAACVLANALRAEQAIWKETRANIDSIAHDTIHALDHMNDCGKNEWEMAFSVVGAVVAVGALTVASGGTAAIALGAVGAAASLGGDIAGQVDEPPKPRFSGESAEAVVESCRQAVKDLKEYVKTAEDKVRSACEAAQGTVSANAEDYQAPKPMILDQDRPDVGRPDRD